MPRHTDTDDRGPTNRRETNSERSGQQTMAEVSHTNPMTGETFGDSQVFERGKVAVVDGGEAESREGGDDRDDDHEDEPMGDVDHTPRKGAPDASEVYDRGVERVDDEEGDEKTTDDDTEPDVEADV